MRLVPSNGPSTLQALAAGQINADRLVEGYIGSRKAAGLITFSANFEADDTVTINGVVFTAKASGAAGNQFNIGGSLSLSLDALVTVLNASVVAAVALATYAKSGTTILTATYDAVGYAGNAFTLAASVGTVSAATLTGGTEADVLNIEDCSFFTLVTLAGTAMAYTLPNGVEGQKITVFLKTKGTGASAVITGVFAAAATTLTFDTAAEFAELQFMGGAWRALSNNSGVFA